MHPQRTDNVTDVVIGAVFRPEVHERFKPIGELREPPANIRLAAAG